MTLVYKGKRWVEILHLACFSMFLISGTFSQSLLNNHSFEQIDSNLQQDCSIGLGYLDALSVWKGLNTVDLVHQDFPFTNRSGIQKIVPHTGKAMVGLYLIDCGEGWLPEYLFQRLLVSVKKGKKYRLSFYLHFRSRDGFYPHQISFNLSDENPCTVRIAKELKGEKVNIEIESSKRSDDSWLFFSKEFVAASDASYIVFGSFENQPKLIRKKGKDLEKGIYVFLDDIDMVDLEYIAPTPDVSTTLTEQAVNQPDTIASKMVVSRQDTLTPFPLLTDFGALPTVSFEYNSFSINPYFQKILSETAANLLQQGCQVVVTGHTDNTGSDEYNEKLAYKRAQAVADFLMSKSLPKERIIIVSQGSKKPLALGEDEFSRSMNRRVEITQKCN
jgi:outer membrane protein OmpA-like peptidoglycan-associated protein